ncbi:hypothetical protein P5V15_015017 [Pogonomyrmex californicus]
MESNVIDTSCLTRGRLDCKVLRMESPHLFWIRLKTGESSLKELMEELGFRMNRKSSTLICWPHLVKINLAVAIKEGDIWHRGIVTAVGRIQGIARVALRDEGREVWRRFNELYILEDRFQELPWQALTCGLAYTGPTVPTLVWSKKIRALCQILAEEQEGYLKIIHPLPHSSSWLFHTKNGYMQLNLRDALVNLGYARIDKRIAVNIYPSVEINKCNHKIIRNTLATDNTSNSFQEKPLQFHFN